MLRIMITDGLAEQRWILQGRLVMPWVAELEKSWKESRSRGDARKCVVDLTDVTLIDAQGEKLLKTMRGAGAELIAHGVYVKHLVEVINSECEPGGSSARVAPEKNLAGRLQPRRRHG
jgi:hypothetical protein